MLGLNTSRAKASMTWIVVVSAGSGVPVTVMGRLTDTEFTEFGAAVNCGP